MKATASEQDSVSHAAPVFPSPPLSSAVCLHAARLRQKAKKKEGKLIGGAQSVRGRLKDDVVSVAVRPRPVGERRERLLVKLCGRG